MVVSGMIGPCTTATTMATGIGALRLDTIRLLRAALLPLVIADKVLKLLGGMLTPTTGSCTFLAGDGERLFFPLIVAHLAFLAMAGGWTDRAMTGRNAGNVEEEEKSAPSVERHVKHNG